MNGSKPTADYPARGGRLVWVVDPNEKRVTVHCSKSPAVVLGMGDEIDATDIVPGFSCVVRRFFE